MVIRTTLGRRPDQLATRALMQYIVDGEARAVGKWWVTKAAENGLLKIKMDTNYGQISATGGGKFVVGLGPNTLTGLLPKVLVESRVRDLGTGVPGAAPCISKVLETGVAVGPTCSLS